VDKSQEVLVGRAGKYWSTKAMKYLLAYFFVFGATSTSRLLSARTSWFFSSRTS
jgi:hypothetical protein